MLLGLNYSSQAQPEPQTIEIVLLFDSGETQPTTKSLNNAQEQLAGLDKYIRIKLKGYTDSVGTEEENLLLSENRANRVKQILIGLGFDGEAISVLANGEANPIADNSSEAGRAQNRRVVLSIR